MFCRYLLILCILALFISVSCSDDILVNSNEIVGSGNSTTIIRDLASFHSISCTTEADINISSGSTQSVSITVDDNVVDYIFTAVSRSGSLTISTDPDVNLSDFYLTINLVMTDLELISLSGAGNITGQNSFPSDNVNISLSGAGNISLILDVDYLFSSLTGAGNIILNGTADTHQLVHTGVGNIMAYGLTTESTIATLSGVGLAQVFASSSLNVTIAGIGSLYYKGDPTITSTITGIGAIIDAN
jgi:Putative auto-transporter adhesin, head GIN domain